MSKFFKVFGNIDWSGEWAEPDPFFSGEILVDKHGMIKGYCNCFPVGRSRYKQYLIGFMSQDGGNEAVLFQVASEDEASTTVFINPDFKKSESRWASMSTSAYLHGEDDLVLSPPKFMAHGGARIHFEEVGVSGAGLFRVNKNWRGLNHASQLIKNLTSNQKIYENILENSNHLFQKTA